MLTVGSQQIRSLEGGQYYYGDADSFESVDVTQIFPTRISQGEEISWHTDGWVQRTGWELCFATRNRLWKY